MDNGGAVLKLQIFAVVLALITLEILAATTAVNQRPSSPPVHSTDPHYRFHYLVKDEKLEERRAPEKLSNGDNVTGSLKTAEPKGDLRIINYTTDDSSGFNTNVNVPVGTTPLKGAALTGSTVMPPYGSLHNNFYRNGISSSLKNHKPPRDMNPIVVKSLTIPPSLVLAPAPALVSTRLGNPASDFFQQPYAFYRESRNDSSTVQGADILNSIRQLVHTNTTHANITTAEKSETSVLENFEMKSALPATTPSALPATVTPTVVNSENKSFDLLSQSLSYSERGGLKSISGIRQTTENIISNRNLYRPPSTNGLNQLQKMDIPSSIMEILNQNNKGQAYTADSGNMMYALPPPNTFTDMNILRSSSGLSDNFMKITENKMNNLTSPGQKDRTNVFVPQRPMRLIGLNPMFVDNVQLQTITENSTMQQLHWEPFPNIQYVAPIPLHAGTLPFGPIAPFHNVPRSVNEPLNSEMPLINPVPLLNSIAISAPVMPQSLPAGETKLDAKTDGKPVPSPFLLCNDCMMPSNYVTYPIVRIPTSASASAPLPATSTPPLLNSIPVPAPSPNLAAIAPQPNANGQKAPCTNNVVNSAPLWASYSPSFPAAYILLPTPILKNKINDTRTLSAKIFTQ